MTGVSKALCWMPRRIKDDPCPQSCKGYETYTVNHNVCIGHALGTIGLAKKSVMFLSARWL